MDCGTSVCPEDSIECEYCVHTYCVVCTNLCEDIECDAMGCMSCVRTCVECNMRKCNEHHWQCDNCDQSFCEDCSNMNWCNDGQSIFCDNCIQINFPTCTVCREEYLGLFSGYTLSHVRLKYQSSDDNGGNNETLNDTKRGFEVLDTDNFCDECLHQGSEANRYRTIDFLSAFAWI